MALSNREFYQLHALLSAERIEQLLDIEDAARALLDIDAGEETDDDWRLLRDAIELVPLQ